jgi:hypothetical protein
MPPKRTVPAVVAPSKAAIEEHLILLVRGKPALYDIAASGFKNEDLKCSYWDEFASSLGVKGTNVSVYLIHTYIDHDKGKLRQI